MRISLLSVLLVLLLILAGCNAPKIETPKPKVPSEQATGFACDSYSEGSRKIMCYAMEKKNIDMCSEIEGRFRDECVVVLAELVYNTSSVSKCGMADAEANRKICEALLSEETGKCFAWDAGEGLGASLAVRDCIDLTARKLRDKEECDLFVTRATDILKICGDTGDCEGQWLDGAQDHANNCAQAIDEALA
ncbi:MAG: hypothetical protein ACE5DM_03385 [Candidatus Nanoarchaeia archaeon]